MTKKITLYFVFAFFSIIVFNELNAQTINLPKEVKFKFGDNLEWSKATFNDIDWENHIIPRSFINDSTYAWYRIRIVIPSTMKSSTGKGIKLRLGKIDDVDQTYFNGKLIGQTGGFPPNYSTEWQTSRIYVIPQNEIQWDKENVIAIRIYNLVGGMGIWEGPFNFEQIGWIDDVSIHENIEEKPNNNFTTRVALINKSENLLEGTIKYWVSNKDKSVLYTETKPVRVQPRTDAETIVTFSDFKPKNEKVFNIGYQINDNNSSLFVKNEQLFMLTNNLEIPLIGEVKPLVQNKFENNFNSIPFQNQQYKGYLDTRFTQNLKERLLKVDEEGLTGSYLNRPGIHPWAGEHIGKYLETASNVWKLTHDPELKKQMDRIAFILINTQLEDGYLGTYTPDQYWTSWDVWSHKYNLHGLLGYYAATGYQPALNASKKMGDLLCKTFGNNEDQSDIIMAGTHIGMAATSVLDAMVDLYKYTSDKKYLDFCYYITDAFEHENGPKVISSMLATGKVAKVGNGKAYEMLSNYVGLVKLYEVTGDTKFLKVSEMAWQDVVDNQLYITGTTSSHEHFQDDDYLPGDNTDNMGEGCVTTTWVQLNMNLFDVTGDIKYLNQLEKSVYNQLLGAENPGNGCVSYYTPLMNKKPYTCHITCCQSSVPRGIALIPNFTFGNLKKVPTVLFYEPANYKETITTINKEKIEATFKITGNFPENGNVSITVETAKSANFPLALRVPSWCKNFLAKIGKETYKGITNEIVTINRIWKSGDKINITFDMPIQSISGGKSYPNKIAFLRGPQVLAFDSLLNSQNINDIILNKNETIKIGKLNLETKSELLPKNWIGNQAFSIDILNSNEKIKLVPFAEASQTGGDMRVWLPLNIKK